MTNKTELDLALGVGGAGEWEESASEDTVVAGVMAVIEDGVDGAKGDRARASAPSLDGQAEDWSVL